MTSEVKPHEPRRGWLKNGNPPGDFRTAARCGAQNRNGCPCQRPAMRNRQRCNLHGGKSTGPRTAAGIERMKAARTIHGGYSREAREQAREVRDLIRQFRELQRSTKIDG